MNLDYVATFATLAEGALGSLFASAGLGGAISSGGPYGTGILAANGVLELGAHFSALPIELVVDWRPFLGFTSGRSFFSLFDLGLSARWFF